MKITNMGYRVEFQGQGAAHIHGTLWLDVKEIENLAQFKEKEQGERNRILSEAFSKLRDDVKLSNAEKEAIAKLTDMFVTCSLNPATIHEDKDIGHKIVNIIKEVNCHRCTNPCKKFGDKCKYGFPRFPLKETLVIDKNEFSNECEDEEQS